MATAALPNSYRVSDAPLRSSPPAGAEDELELPMAYAKPLLLAIARNPHTLFVYWSVDWPVAFGNDLPPDRKAQVKLWCRETERIQPVEPLLGSCSLGGLTAGQTYLVELGYFGRGQVWHAVVPGHEVMMPLDTAPDEGADVDVATVPFHLHFQRLIDIFGENRADLVSELGEIETRTAETSPREDEAEKLLRALGISEEDLQMAIALRQRLSKMRPPSLAEKRFGGSSPVHFSAEHGSWISGDG